MKREAFASQPELRQVILNWNDTATPYPRGASVSRLFEMQAERDPGAPAVLLGDRVMAYGELNARANQLARSLRRLGVGPETRVALCVERSFEMIIALLAILKAGGAYVPLDPAYPGERLSFILEDAQAPVLLTQESLRAALPEYSGSTLLVDEAAKSFANESTENLDGSAYGESLAYVMYTSGSTGRPKGVAVIHRAIVRLVTNTNYAEFSPHEVFLQFAPISFDASTFEIWGALLNGGRLALMPPGPASLEELGAAVGHFGVTTLWLTAGVFHQMVDGPLASLRGVKQLLAGGDVLSVPHVEKALETLPGCRLINGYGPTENTTFTCCYEVPRGEPLGTSLSIGRPIANTRVYILDEARRPVSVGDSGEIYIAGDGLARGYLDRPQLNEEKFVTSPFPDLEPGRLYRSGDLGRYLPDGNIQFLGRLDQQVKIRGYRIEPGEVEAAITSHPRVRESIVVAHESPRGEKRLTAYLIPETSLRAGSSGSSEIGAESGFSADPPAPAMDQKGVVPDLRRFLERRLPAFMLPSSFVVLESWPLTPNGKVDRRALPVPTPDRPDLDTPFIAPRSPLEESLCEICGELLGIERIGIDDNFFELGGHSLVATQLVSRVRAAFNVELPLCRFFETPTIRDTTDWISRTRREPRDLTAVSIPRAPRTGDLPLSPSQENVWFMQQLEPDNRAYQFQPTLRFRGQLDIGVLERSLAEITRRHEIFRTTFPAVAGTPVQRIHEAAPPPLAVVDLQEIPDGTRDEELRRWIDQEIRRPFNLENLPLVRWTLFRLGPEDHVLQHVEHHIVHDGWSFNVFLRELATLYRSFREGRPSPLPEPEIQFADFAAFQRRWMEGEQAASQRAYWTKKLAGAPPALEIPSDRPRPAVQSFRGATPVVELPADLAESIRALSRREGCTLFMTTLATFATLLYRYTGREDFCIGSGVANRRWLETESLLGMLVNMVALRMDLGGDPSFVELLRRVRTVTLEGYENQDYPFSAVVDSVQPKRTLSYAPLCQVLFSFHDSPLPDLDFGGLQLDLQEFVSSGSAKFDLNIISVPRPEQRVGQSSKGSAKGITLAWEYNTDLFDEPTAHRMIGHFETLLRSIVADPEQSISSLPMLTKEEGRTLLQEWNPPAAAAPVTFLHASFERQVQRAPDAVAVEFEGERLTYRELNRRSNQLASYLRRLGVGPNVLVGICLERSLEMIVALIGVVKSGGAYLPLDPAYPAERLAFMLEDAQTSVLLTEERLLESLQVPEGVRVCRIDRDAEMIGAEEGRDLEHLGSPESPAYVIYTSGSTGKPKGVLVTHGNVDRLFAATEPWFQFDERDVWTMFHSYAFDFSVWELWGALRYGGRLVVVPRSVTRAPEAFHALLVRAGVTVLNQTPSAFRQFIAADGSSTDSLRLRLVIFGGEALDPGMLKPWFERHGDESPQIVNMYGITETTVHVTYHVVTRADLSQPSMSVIGRPIPDLQIYILDDRLQLCPIGIPGELHVAGAGLAIGYLHRPELTSQRFIPNPFATQPGERLYKTGDRGRYLADGQIEYLGRLDQQVKIRGHRIELGEIESILGQHPGVREAIVVAREDAPGDRRLVAYVVGTGGVPLSTSEMRSFLKRLLPEHMVPSGFVSLDHMPLTPSGKVDRKALPTPDATRPELEEAFVAPQSHAEKVLAGIWAQVLKMERIGIHDNFFELGGDSILSIQIVARANQAGLRLAPKHLFQHQTIAELAAVAELSPAISADQGLVSGKVPLTPIQRWFFEGESPNPHHFNQAFLLEFTQRPNTTAMEKVVGRLLVHHDALRLRFVEVGNGWEQLDAAAEDNTVFSSIDLSALARSEQDSAIEAEAAGLQTSLHLCRGPLIRVALFDLGANRPSRLLIVVHHIAIDGVSWRILLEDLQTAYGQVGRGEEIALPLKTTSFKAWAEKLAAYARSESPRQEIDHWLAQPGGRIIRLPADTAGVNLEESVRKVSVSLDEAETQALLQDAPSAYHTQINDILLTALANAFASWTGLGALPVNLEGHGREEVAAGMDLSRTVGWFTSIFPVMLNLRDGADPGDSLRAVKEQLRAIPNRGIGYGLLRYLADDPEVVAWLKALPQPEVSFNYLGRFDQLLADTSPFAITGESGGATRSPHGLRRHLLDVQGLISGGRLRVDWFYSENIHRRATIERVATGFVEALRALIAHCRSIVRGEYTPADFPLARFNQERLDRVIRKFDKQ